LGIHALAWCDTVNNLNRTLDRQSLKEFEIRVLFFSEEQGDLEKFRPYALPEDEWLAQVAEQMSRRTT